MKLNYIILTISGILFTTQIQAQTTPNDTTLNRTVIVEQQYNPDIMDAQKINVVPQIAEPSITPKEVEYDTSDYPVKAIPGTPMAAYAGKEIQEKAQQGYARFGYGSNGNLDAKANYLFNLSTNDKLNVGFSMDGMKGDIDSYNNLAKEWNQYYYQTRVGIDYLHNFSTLDMNIGGNFGLSNFNYQSILSSIPRQRFTSGDVKVGLSSTSDDFPFHFKVGTNLLLFSRQYTPSFYRNKSLNETLVRTHADVWAYISEEQKIGVYGMIDNRFYNADYYKNNTAITLSPYYNYEDDSWKVNLGANVDIGFGFGKKIQVSPDICAEYIFADSYIIYAKATGGRIKNDLRRFEYINPYAMPNTQIEDSYEQINISLGFKASLVPGFWLNFYGGYQNIKRDLSYAITHIEDAPFKGMIDFFTSNTDNVYGGIQANYEYKDLFAATAKGQFNKWSAKSDAALLTKPQFNFEIQGTARVLPELEINLGYELITRKKVQDFYKMASVSNLSLGATYKLLKDISIYVRASNLINKDYSYYNYYQAQGINFIGGMSFRF